MGGYRYAFNGKENDKDFGNQQIVQDYGFRIYNPSIGRFLSTDPLASSYPWYTPYQFAGNMPTSNVDLDGLEDEYYLNQKASELTGNGYTAASDATGVVTKVAVQTAIIHHEGKSFERNKLREHLSKSTGTIGIPRSSIHHPNAFTEIEKASQLGADIGGVAETGVAISKFALKNGPKIASWAKGLKNLDVSIELPRLDVLHSNPFIKIKIKLKGSGKNFDCCDFADDFIDKLGQGKIEVEKGTTIRKLEFRAATDFIFQKGEQISQNGLHRFIEVTGKNGDRFIFDNNNPGGIPADDWWSSFDGIPGQNPYTPETGKGLEKYAIELDKITN